MTRLEWIIAATISLAVAALLGPLASGLPDGLEWATERAATTGLVSDAAMVDSPMSGYETPGVSGPLSTATSGVVGVIIVGGALTGLGRLVQRRSKRGPADADA